MSPYIFVQAAGTIPDFDLFRVLRADIGSVTPDWSKP